MGAFRYFYDPHRSEPPRLTLTHEVSRHLANPAVSVGQIKKSHAFTC